MASGSDQRAATISSDSPSQPQDEGAGSARPAPVENTGVRTVRVLLPLPLAEVGPMLALLRVPRAAAQEALNEGLRAGEVRLARSEDGVLVVATGGV